MTKRVRSTMNLSAVTPKARAGAARGLGLAMEHLLTESRKEVPLEEGTLERSGAAVTDAANLRGAVSYDTKYAVRQHEELDWQHDAGRKAKYLEDPLNQEGSTMLALVAAQTRRALR
ncbi:MAG TPA: hypothetical protein VNO31_35555 [Umezawaea sp.]|nr:hypothetical protein [Umezawaea sp.]